MFFYTFQDETFYLPQFIDIETYNLMHFSVYNFVFACLFN